MNGEGKQRCATGGGGGDIYICTAGLGSRGIGGAYCFTEGGGPSGRGGLYCCTAGGGPRGRGGVYVCKAGRICRTLEAFMLSP